MIFTPFRSDDHSKAIHSWGVTNDGVIFTPFRSNDHSKAIHYWGVTALWSDHHSIGCRYLEAGVTYAPFGGVTSWFGVVKLTIGK